MNIKKGNSATLTVAVRDGNKELIDNLSSATAILFMVKTSKTDPDIDAIISKSVGAGVTVDDPSTGYVKIELLPTDTDQTINSYYMALQIEWGAASHYEIDLSDETFVITQDIIRG